jgi:hypothetical protein
VEFPVHVRMDITPVAEVKREAGAQHISQGGVGMRRGLIGLITRLFGEKEDYMRAYPPVNGNARRRHDLFDGV